MYRMRCGRGSVLDSFSREVGRGGGLFRKAVESERGAMNGEMGMAGNICTMRRTIARVGYMQVKCEYDWLLGRRR